MTKNELYFFCISRLYNWSPFQAFISKWHLFILTTIFVFKDPPLPTLNSNLEGAGSGIRWGQRLTSLNIQCVYMQLNKYAECVYLSANRFPTIWENGIRTSIFVFRLPKSSENRIRDSVFDFRFPTTLKMEMELLFSFLVFPRLWTTKF